MSKESFECGLEELLQTLETFSIKYLNNVLANIITLS